MTEDTIVAAELQETEFGEKLALQSPYDALQFMKSLPWKTLEEEVAEHGSLRAKLEDRDVEEGAINAAEDFGFSDDFAAHASWEPRALDPDTGAWMIDPDAWEEASEFFEFAGFEVENKTNL